MSCWILSNGYDGANHISRLLNKYTDYRFNHVNKEVVCGYGNNYAFDRWCILYKNLKEFKKNLPNSMELSSIQYYEMISSIELGSRLSDLDFSNYDTLKIKLNLKCFNYSHYNIDHYILMRRNILDQAVDCYLDKRGISDIDLLNCYYHFYNLSDCWNYYLEGLGNRYIFEINYEELLKQETIINLFKNLCLSYDNSNKIELKDNSILFEETRKRLINLLGGKHV